HPLIFQHAPILAAGWWQWLPQGLILALGLILVWHLSRHYRWVFLPGLLFFIVLSPTSPVIPIPADPQLEHRMYLPSFFVIILGLGLASALFRLLNLERWVGLCVFVVVTSLFAAATVRRVQDYRT